MKEAMDVIDSLPVKKGIVVFDIDDTLLRPLSGEPIQPVVNFYNYIFRIGFTPVIITARLYNDITVNYTVRQLNNISISSDKYRMLYFRPTSEPDVSEYKAMTRKMAQDEIGEEIVMSVGDMPWDYGKYGGYGIRVGL